MKFRLILVFLHFLRNNLIETATEKLSTSMHTQFSSKTGFKFASQSKSRS